MTQLALIPEPRPLPLRETATWRTAHSTSTASLTELLAALIGGAKAMDTAGQLINRFGDVHGLDSALAEELAALPGMGLATATRIKAAMALGRRLLASGDSDAPVIRSPADAAAILQPLLIGREQEYLVVLILNTRNGVIGEPREIYHGSLNSSLIRIGEVFRDAIRVNAAAIVVAHNHPSGIAEPSPEDIQVTKSIREAGKMLDIALLDHIIVGNPRWVSLKERGLGFN
jgi:DNA repair protein RadC